MTSTAAQLANDEIYKTLLFSYHQAPLLFSEAQLVLHFVSEIYKCMLPS